MLLETDSPLIYLDNAATTFPKPEVVYKAMDSFYRNYGGNAGRGANPLARKAAHLVAETRELLKIWLDAPDVVILSSATIALNTVIMGARLRAGDIVYVSPFEHNSVLRPLAHLRKTTGIDVRILPFDKQTFTCKLDEVQALFKIEPPSMLCISQVSNVFGAILPVDELTKLAKQASPQCITLVDGAQAAGLKLMEMKQVDGLVFSGHKSLYGPFGVAGIAFGTNWRPLPLIYGGTGTQSESLDMPVDGHSRYEAGSHNISAIAGLNAALKWLHETGRDAINTHTDELIVELVKNLQRVPNGRVFVPRYHTSIVSLLIEGISPQSIEAALGAKNIAVRSGLHCAPWSHEWAGTAINGGAVRVSIGFHSTLDYIIQLCDTLHLF
ncbi:MAG TPA: aminotransferase class V-fold PLP-dependent enzyme [Aggregatilineales bacterium]|nr:aminotransferase class V-fold PLP-dependent enzyme [Aggregatilineales bacterium]